MEVAFNGAVALGAPGARHVCMMCTLRRMDVNGGTLQRATLLREPVRRLHVVVVYHSDLGTGIPRLWLLRRHARRHVHVVDDRLLLAAHLMTFFRFKQIGGEEFGDRGSVTCVWMTSEGLLDGENLPGAGEGASEETRDGPLRWSQCSTTVTRPLLSMIFHDGVSSCSSSAWIVSQTIFGIAEMATNRNATRSLVKL